MVVFIQGIDKFWIHQCNCPDPKKWGQKNEDKNTDNQFVEDFLDDVFDDNLLNDFSLSHFSANEPRIFVEEAFSDSLDTSFDQTFDQTSLDMVKRKNGQIWTFEETETTAFNVDIGGIIYNDISLF